MKIFFISILTILLTPNYDSESKYNNHYFYKNYIQCSETTLCADGYTTLGIDRLGNNRVYNYPKKDISKRDYVSKYKIYDSEGYDKFGFDRNGINKEFKHYKNVKIMTTIN